MSFGGGGFTSGGTAGAALALEFGAPVQNVADLRALGEVDRNDQMQRLVEDKGVDYRFDSTGVGVDDGDLIIVPTVGSGRWFKTAQKAGALPVAHDLAGAEHNADSLANLNTKVSDATLDDVSGNRTDADAVHDNVSAEISAITEKVAPVGADLLLIEDSAAANAKKKVQIINLPGAAMLPVVDTTSIVEGSADATKEMRIEVDGLTTATVRVATMPDKDITWDDAADSRSPTTHGADHISTGSDPVPAAVAAGASGLLTGSDKTKIDGLGDGTGLKNYVKTTDDLKALVAAALAGDHFILETGDHTINTTGGGVTLSVDNITIEGPIGARLVGGGQGGAMVTIPTGTDRFRLIGFRIEPGGSDLHGVHITGASTEGLIERVRFLRTASGASADAIRIDGTDSIVEELRILNCHFEENEFAEAIMFDMTEVVAGTAQVRDVMISGCRFFKIGIRVDRVSGTPDHLRVCVEDCNFELGGNGIRFAAADTTPRFWSIDNCIFNGQTSNGIQGTSSWDNCTVGDCIFINCGVAGITTGGGDLSSINDCHFSECPTAINVNASFDRGCISNNTSDRGTVIAAAGYIITSGIGSVFEGNVAFGHTDGLDMNGGSDWVIANNSLSQGSGDGINLAGVSESAINGNRCDGNTGTGIVETATCDQNLYVGNHLRGNTAAAKSLLGTNRTELGTKV